MSLNSRKQAGFCKRIEALHTHLSPVYRQRLSISINQIWGPSLQSQPQSAQSIPERVARVLMS